MFKVVNESLSHNPLSVKGSTGLPNFSGSISRTPTPRVGDPGSNPGQRTLQTQKEGGPTGLHAAFLR